MGWRFFDFFWVDVLVFFEFLSWWVNKLMSWLADLSCTSCVRRAFILCWHHRENKLLLIYRNIKSQDYFKEWTRKKGTYPNKPKGYSNKTTDYPCGLTNKCLRLLTTERRRHLHYRSLNHMSMVACCMIIYLPPHPSCTSQPTQAARATRVDYTLFSSLARTQHLMNNASSATKTACKSILL